MGKPKGNIRKRGKAHGFQVNYLDASGKRRWRSFGTRRLAEAFLRRE